MEQDQVYDPNDMIKKHIKSWCDYNREKYGENWKEILAKEMSKETMKQLGGLALLCSYEIYKPHQE